MPKIAEMDVSLVGLGCNNFGGRCDEEQSAAVVQAALDAGITFFDTADIYGGTLSEEYLGRALKGRRDEVTVATKFGGEVPGGGKGASPDYVRQAAEASLARLGTDRLDLYQLHFPDAATPLEDTLGALHELVTAGKVLAIGCSNFRSSQLEEAEEMATRVAGTPFATVQNEMSLLQRRAERNVLPACEELGVAFLPYFPLASGLLTGKYHRGQTPVTGTRLAGMPAERTAGLLSEGNFDVVERLSVFASERGHTLLELAMSWLATRPAMGSIIAGATRPEQVRANVAAANWALSREDLAAIDAIAPLP